MPAKGGREGLSFVPPSSVQHVLGQDRTTEDFESTADVHLVNAESEGDDAGSTCTVS